MTKNYGSIRTKIVLQTSFVVALLILVAVAYSLGFMNRDDRATREAELDVALDSLALMSRFWLISGTTSDAKEQLVKIADLYSIQSIRVFNSYGELLIEYTPGIGVDTVESGRSASIQLSRQVTLSEATKMDVGVFEEVYEYQNKVPAPQAALRTLGAVDIVASHIDGPTAPPYFAFYLATLFGLGLLLVVLNSRLITRVIASINDLTHAIKRISDGDKWYLAQNVEASELRGLSRAASSLSVVLSNANNYLATMIHEIRNPLNSMILHQHLASDELSEIALDDDHLTASLQHLKDSNNSAEMLQSLINDVLDVEKVWSGDKLELNNEWFDIDDLINSCVSLVGSIYDHENVEIVKPENLGPQREFYGDDTRIKQVLINLLANSLKYTTKGYMQVSLEIVENDKDSSEIHVNVKDTGIGIAPDILDQVFDPYVRAKDDVDNYGSRGLGLFITKTIIEGLGGTIEMSSTPGFGTEVTFHIVVKNANTRNNLQNSMDADKLKDALQGRRVLAVDDVPVNIKAIVGILRRYGMQVDYAYRGRDAIKLIKDASYDAVLMDLSMPEMSGQEAVRIIRNELKEDMPIIALSGSVHQSTKEECLAAGMEYFVPKPVNRRILLSTLYYAICGEDILDDTAALDNRVAPGFDAVDACVYGVNTDHVMNTLGHDVDLVLLDLDYFIDSSSALCEDMQAALDVGDLAAIVEISHRLKTAAANIGAKEVESIAVLLDDHSMDKFFCKTLVMRLSDIMPDVLHSARKQLAKLKANRHDDLQAGCGQVLKLES